MPIEIRELIIRAFVEPADSRTSSEGTNQVSESEEIQTESLEQLLDLIKNKNER
jgi:hypothetical protein